MTSDVPAAKKFYGELFGWTFEDMPMEELTYSVLKARQRCDATARPSRSIRRNTMAAS